MSDGWELENGLDPNVNDADDDLDGDTLSNIEEYELGSAANETDSDADGVSDEDEDLDGTDAADASDNRPEANAGPDKLGTLGVSTTLVGAGTDPNGDALTYSWRFASIPGRSSLTDSNMVVVQLRCSSSRPPEYVP